MDPVAASASQQTGESSRVSDRVEREIGLQSSHHITVEGSSPDKQSIALSKPPFLKHVSSPAYSSPLRHHRRNPSTPHRVKESLDARSEYVTSQDDGVAEHRINQYVIKQEIGRGSFGAVHLAVDQFGQEYAVKEFSKARLRKRAQSHVLRKPPTQRRRGALQGFNNPLHRMGIDPLQNDKNGESSINLIKEEIAIMKKLHHPNLVTLIEVLDDPSEDSLYMVMEMCKKGVVMKVDLEHQADPYPEDLCRYWFRDLILGIEYLHAQGVVHRDIKPDNCLITNDDVLKVVDFGVSEMFEKDSEMKTAKSAGSPAFLPPELCVARHGDVSGKAADIWSMGVTLYCLKYGRIPFEKHQILELYESIQTDQPDLSKEKDGDFQDLMMRILEKDPSKRITMQELRDHAWVTQQGNDPLLSEHENTAHPVEPPTKAEMDAAITGNMRSLMTVVRAVNKFKSLTAGKRPPQMASILGDKNEARFSQPPDLLNQNPHQSPQAQRSQSLDIYNRDPVEGALVAEGVHRDLGLKFDVPQNDGAPTEYRSSDRDNHTQSPPQLLTERSSDYEDIMRQLSRNEGGLSADQVSRLPPFRSPARTADELGRRGHAHDPLEDTLYLYIGPSTYTGVSTEAGGGDSFVPDGEADMLIVSESPGAADMDIYETAYRDEIERILAKAKAEEKEPQVYLTRRVDAKLMAISGRAGRWIAVGEEAKNQLKDYTQFSARKAKVADVSRALRAVAKQEYEKRKALIEAEKTEKAKQQDTPGEPEILESPSAMSPEPEADSTVSADAGTQSAGWKGKAVDRSRQARTQFMGLMDMVKNKNRPGKS